MIVAEIVQDKLHDPNDSIPSRVGFKFTLGQVRNALAIGDLDKGTIPTQKTLFRISDDDGNQYYRGWLYNDFDCLIQEFLVNWARMDAGATMIEVKDTDTNEWVQEIG